MTPARGREMIDFVRGAFRVSIRRVPSHPGMPRDVSLPISPTRAGAPKETYS
jgi:hypothetical protein